MSTCTILYFSKSEKQITRLPLLHPPTLTQTRTQVDRQHGCGNYGRQLGKTIEKDKKDRHKFIEDTT